MGKKKTIMVAPLNWGLGHATRCIPIINKLLKNNYKVLIASDGIALKLLKKEFSQLSFIELPSYNISYSKNGNYLRFKLLYHVPSIIKAIRKEQKLVKTLVANNQIHGIISDNRFGIYHQDIPSIYITHQINVLSGNTTFLTSKLHQFIIKKFDECWIPDVKHTYNLSGLLSINNNASFYKYIGVLSRLKKIKLPVKHNILILLSGPEPHRELLENKLINAFKNSSLSIALIQGVPSKKQKTFNINNITCYNFMTSKELETIINQSDLILARSGYSTIMDLSKLEKKAFFIPTPGQFEQEYLAEKMYEMKWAPYCKQKDFSKELLTETKKFIGLQNLSSTLNIKELFNIFERK